MYVRLTDESRMNFLLFFGKVDGYISSLVHVFMTTTYDIIEKIG